MRMFHRELTLIFYLAAVLVSAEIGCPSPENVEPCECDPTENIRFPIMTLTCAKINDSGVLLKVFENTMRYYFTTFALVESHLSYIPHMILDDVKVIILSLHNVTLKYMFDEAPTDDTFLKELKAVKVKVLAGWDWKQLAGFKQLEQLDILDTPLKKLPADFRSSVSKRLRGLSLKNCSIKKLQDDVFADLTVLEQFDLSNNAIVVIKRTMFPRKANIRNFILMYNKISTVPSDMFSDMPLLGMVSLRGNMMAVLSEATFQPVVMSQLRYLDVTENPIQCDCRIAWVLQERRERISGKCYAPKALRDKAFNKLTREDIRCSNILLHSLQK
ncbi:hypothetical protein JTE90_002661 [Oedothorax gibbosus]|uniref:Uncharacterized protein n=1 Tax=Oedothorax gibbosus TaxID=931172 RepID=A0AAV6UDR4_9ARAC|nr:hypothetical protein JTE90_002661 [Oedothorax gibbosus]